MSSNLTNFYYLYKYGAAVSSGAQKSFLSNGQLLNSTFAGSLLDYNRFDMQHSLDFTTQNNQNVDDSNSFTDFYTSYKAIVGSDALSYLNKYTKTDNMALGDMVNLAKTNASGALLDSYTTSFSPDSDSFYYRTTLDGNPYRYTSNGSAEALKDVDTDTYVNFNDLTAGYKSYYEYKSAQLSGAASVPALSSVKAAVNLTNLGLDFSQISVGRTTADITAIYQNLINQIEKETAAIKANTMSAADIVTMERDLADKQRGLKAIDDALYGYVEAAAKIPVQTTSYVLTQTIDNTLAASAQNAIDTLSLGYGITPGSGTTNKTGLLTSIGSITISGMDSAAVVTAFTSSLKGKIETWVDDNMGSTPFGAAITPVDAAVKAVVTRINDNVGNYMGALTTLEKNAVGAKTSLADIKTWLNSNLSKTYVDSNNVTQTVSINATEVDNIANMFWVNNTTNQTSFGNKLAVTNWVSTNYSSLTGTEQANAADIIWRNHQLKQKDAYVNDLLNAIKAPLALTPTTKTDTTYVVTGDITERSLDQNYSGSTGGMYLNDSSDLTYLISNVMNNVHQTYAWDDGDGDTNRVRTISYAVPAVEVYKIFHKMGIEITTDADGKNVVKNGLDGNLHPNTLGGDVSASGLTCTWGTNGAYSDTPNALNGAYGVGTQESLYGWLSSNPSALVNDGEGKFHFTVGGKTYYIDTNTNCDLTQSMSTVVGASVFGNVEQTNKMADRLPIPQRVCDVVVAAFNAGKISGGTGTLEMRHLKAIDTTKGVALTDVDPSTTVYKPNTDEESIVYKLAASLLENNDITFVAGEATADDQREFAVYLSEVTAGLMERYWIENFNKSDAEPIDLYFARELRSYLNPNGSGAGDNPKFNFVNSKGVVAKLSTSFTEDPAATNIVDRLMEKQSWAEMLVKMEDRSRSEMALFEEATAMDTIVNVNNKEYEYRMNLLASLEQMANSTGLALDFSKVNTGLIEEGPGAQKNPWWSEYFPWFKGSYGNLPTGATPDQMFDENGHMVLKYSAPGSALVDPYLVKINGVDYVMGKDDDKDGEISNAQEILGITDTVDTTFASLTALDTNKDGFVSQEELKAQNIIFKAMNESERMNGSSISSDFIKGIDLSTLKKGDGTNAIYGLFDVKLTNGQKAAAVQTFESQSYFNNLFGKYADMSFLTATTASSTPATTTAQKSVASTSTQAQVTETASTTNKALLGKNFNFFTYLKTSEEEAAAKTEDTTSTEDVKEEAPIVKAPVLEVEKAKTVLVNNKEMTLDGLIDDICWKLNIGQLTAKQRYDILGSIDTTKTSDVIIAKVQEKVNKLHTQFSA